MQNKRFHIRYSVFLFLNISYKELLYLIVKRWNIISSNKLKVNVLLFLLLRNSTFILAKFIHRLRRSLNLLIFIKERKMIWGIQIWLLFHCKCNQGIFLQSLFIFRLLIFNKIFFWLKTMRVYKVTLNLVTTYYCNRSNILFIIYSWWRNSSSNASSCECLLSINMFLWTFLKCLIK